MVYWLHRRVNDTAQSYYYYTYAMGLRPYNYVSLSIRGSTLESDV